MSWFGTLSSETETLLKAFSERLDLLAARDSGSSCFGSIQQNSIHIGVEYAKLCFGRFGRGSQNGFLACENLFCSFF